MPNRYEDLKTHHQGTMPRRAYYIPASGYRDDLEECREHSDRFQLLNGKWKFKHYTSVHDLNELFYEPDFDTGDYDSIPVPGVWQNYGYGQQYRDSFLADAPVVSYENPCGAYVKKFTYQKDEKAPRAYLNFEGVGSCFYVWLNGQYLGCSVAFCDTSEFDVTEKIVAGENTLAVLVMKWCNGSDQENRGKLPIPASSGIFRDVYLLKRPERHIRDYFLTTQMTGQEATVRIRFTFHGEKMPVAVKLLNADGKLVAKADIQDITGSILYAHQAVFTVKNPILWNPEQSYRYTLLLETENEVITDHVGLRCVHVDNDQVYLNGEPVKFRFINQQDAYPVTEAVASLDQKLRDLKRSKANNFKALRTGRYPKDAIVSTVV